MVSSGKTQGGRTSAKPRGGFVFLKPARGRVVLFLPPYEGKVFGPPLGLLSLASSLKAAGFTPVIIDGALSPNYLPLIKSEIGDCIAFGVSLLTGPMIRDAVTAS